MRLFIVDAFAERPFQGNPAAVCPLEAPAAPVWMQRVAAEMNLSETAFVVARSDGFDLRWFTPMVEVDLCGHATLASAHLLWEQELAPRNGPIRFHTKSGVLTCSRIEPRMIELDFPAEPAEPAAPPAELAAALGAEPLFVGRNRFDLLVELASERELRAVCPDFGRLAKIAVRGVIITARSDEPRFDFVSRFFAPAVGVNEDPVWLGPLLHGAFLERTAPQARSRRIPGLAARRHCRRAGPTRPCRPPRKRRDRPCR